MFSKHILVVLGCVIAGILAAPADLPPEKLQPTVIPIVAQSEELEPNGTYKFSYETGNGIMREETAYEKILPRARDANSSEGGEDDEGDSNEIHVQRGSYSYTAPDGTLISVSYIADENGFQPIGDHLPRSPVLVPASNSVEKSGRALKIADSSESASAPAEVKVDEPIESAKKETKPEAAPAAISEETKSVPVDEAKPESAPVPVDEAKTESIPASLIKNNKPESISTPTVEQIETTSLPAAVDQEAKSDTDGSTTEQAAEAKSTLTETGLQTTEPTSTVAEASTTEVSEATSANVEVSTEAASTTVSAQSTTESEQTSTASPDQASISIPQSTASNEESEQLSSTSAPESASSGGVVGPSISTEAVDQSSMEEVRQSSTNAPESTSTEKSSSATTA
ncbi:flocculation protein FLO11-like [Maniola jurtina]|uniref:flocculation protein FLO11-like n=1 Tax=Maniola jurtina TaxID=191418 RepID=UPI001E68FBCA|nr:flocculation protein FLO11-like [Maniola jurtina]